MNLKLRLSLICITLIVFGSLCLLINNKEFVQVDRTILTFIQSLETSFLTATMKFFTVIGSGYAINIIAFISVLVLFLFFHYESELLLFALVLTGSHYFFRFLKVIFQRDRPDINRLIDIGGYSFPSGHAMNAIVLYGILVFLLWRRIPTRNGRIILVTICTLMIFSIGLSRIYLGVHYPSDVLAGYFAGALLLLISIWCFQLIKEKFPKITHAK